MARTDPQVNFRIPEYLLEQIKRAAGERSERSITKEIVDRLTGSFLVQEEIARVNGDYALMRESLLIAQTVSRDNSRFVKMLLESADSGEKIDKASAKEIIAAATRNAETADRLIEAICALEVLRAGQQDKADS